MCLSVFVYGRVVLECVQINNVSCPCVLLFLAMTLDKWCYKRCLVQTSIPPIHSLTLAWLTQACNRQPMSLVCWWEMSRVPCVSVQLQWLPQAEPPMFSIKVEPLDYKTHRRTIGTKQGTVAKWDHWLFFFPTPTSSFVFSPLAVHNGAADCTLSSFFLSATIWHN